MCSHHQPQQIENERPIRSHGSVFGPKSLNDLDFDYTRWLCVHTVRGHARPFSSILPKIKGKREKGILS